MNVYDCLWWSIQRMDVNGGFSIYPRWLLAQSGESSSKSLSASHGRPWWTLPQNYPGVVLKHIETHGDLGIAHARNPQKLCFDPRLRAKLCGSFLQDRGCRDAQSAVAETRQAKAPGQVGLSSVKSWQKKVLSIEGKSSWWIFHCHVWLPEVIY